MRVHRTSAAALAALLLALSMAVPAFAASVAPVQPASVDDAVAAAPKVVIVVGATHEATESYREDGDLFYAEAIKYTPNVVRVYSPNATWKNVKAAAQGASILIYLGHGSGYPRNDSAVFDPDNHDGMGLNSAADPDDYVAKYYGESYMANDLRLAKNAVVILSHLCYASGNSQTGDPEPTVGVARQRIDNFASGFLRAGARAVIADVWNSGVTSYIRSIFTTDQTVSNMWATAPSNHGHQMPFVPTRNPAYQAVMDPTNWTSSYYRSIVTSTELRTSDIVGGAGAAFTGTDPATFQAPGAASVGSAPVALYEDADLTTPTGDSIAAGAKVRVTDLAAPAADGAPASLGLETSDGSTAGWASGSGLVPRDSAGPKVWSVDGPTSISPNHDGLLDTLNLVARFSETASWTASIRDADGNEVRSQSGSGHQAFISWDATIGGEVAPEGDYTWHVHAADAWGNEPDDASGDVTVVYEPTPGNAVLSFKPARTVTTSSTVSYGLTFAGPVSGLTAGDFSKSGTATKCKVGAPAGGPTTFTVTVTDCSAGTLTLTLNAGTVADTAATAGPAGPVSAAKVTIDRTAPSVGAPQARLRAGVQLPGGGKKAALPMTVTWSGSDGGAGVASYDVKLSYDGAKFQKIAGGLAGTSLNWSMKPGHSYRFKVRARDKVGNVSSWAKASTWSPALTQQSSTAVKYAGTWATQGGASYSADSVKYATGAGASASYAFSGRAVAWLTTFRPDGGEVRVYVDGSLVATVDTNADSVAVRRVAFARAWSGYGAHTIKLVVVGTAGTPRGDLDAFEVIR